MHTTTLTPTLSTEALAARRRRVNASLYDLGLLDIVGHEWINVTPDGFTFEAIDGRVAEVWLRRLDLLAQLVPGSMPVRQVDGQQRLRFGATTAGRHLVVVGR